MTDQEYTLEDFLNAPVLGTLRDGKINWKTDEARAAYQTPNTSIVQSAQPARAFITRPHGRFEVIVKDTFMHEGVLMARVCFVADLKMYSVDYPFEFPASTIEVEAGEPVTVAE